MCLLLNELLIIIINELYSPYIFNAQSICYPYKTIKVIQPKSSDTNELQRAGVCNKFHWPMVSYVKQNECVGFVDSTVHQKI